MTTHFQLLHGDCREQMRLLPDCSIDAIITDPPYELGFMGKAWDNTGIANNVEMWKEALRVLKPGGHLLAFGGSRTYHRMACAIEDAGFQIRDQIMWVYGSGFPKSHHIGKAINKMDGVEFTVKPASGVGFMNAEGKGDYNITTPATDKAKQWKGWGTALKPAHEPIVLARKPLDGTVANNVLVWGVGGLNIDGCRVGDAPRVNAPMGAPQNSYGGYRFAATATATEGRWPANFIHDGSDEVLELFPESKTNRIVKPSDCATDGFTSFDSMRGNRPSRGYDGDGSAARFFYCPKTNKHDRNEGLDGQPIQRRAGLQGADNDKNNLDPVSERFRTQPAANHHPTVKPANLMRYLCRLITPPNGTILDPFMGSGSTGKAAILEGFSFIGIEQDPEYIDIAKARIKQAQQPQ